MTRYFLNTQPVTNLRDLCTRMGKKEFQSPYRSTVPLLSLIEHSQPQWDSLLASLGAPANLPIYIEYSVPSPKPGGNPSQTDVMLMSGTAVWAVEAKWTEPRYETVRSRISGPGTSGANPQAIVDGWLKYIQPFTAQNLNANNFLNVVYQVLHRTASACAVATKQDSKPEVVYLHFDPSPDPGSANTDQYIDDLRSLKSLLGNQPGVGFKVVEMPLQPTQAFNAIKNLSRGQSATAIPVSDALCNGPVFSFGDPVVTIV